MLGIETTIAVSVGWHGGVVSLGQQHAAASAAIWLTA